MGWGAGGEARAARGVEEDPRREIRTIAQFLDVERWGERWGAGGRRGYVLCVAATDRDQDLAGTGTGITLFWPGPGFGRDWNLAGTGIFGRDF